MFFRQFVASRVMSDRFSLLQPCQTFPAPGMRSLLAGKRHQANLTKENENLNPRTIEMTTIPMRILQLELTTSLVGA